MRTTKPLTKERREGLRQSVTPAHSRDDEVTLALLDDVDELLENAHAVALAAGLPATATPAEVVEKVKAMHSVLLTLHKSVMKDVDDLAARLASEAGR